MISSGVNLVMTAIGFGVSTLFIVFICTRLIWARIQLHAARRRRAASSFPVSSQTDLAVLERGLHGLEAVMISNFPTKKYGEDGFFPCAEHSQCTVCLSEYRPGDMLRILPNCGHSFHATCIDIWLQQHSTCPVCRVSLHEFPEKSRLMQPSPSSACRYQHRGMASCHSPHCILANQSLPSRSHNCPMMAGPLQETRCTHEKSTADGIRASPSLNDARQFSKDTGQDHAGSQSSA
ncbi:hypothetical protein MLD38_008600 [Melastoma candidum]|uniref:Uncharacterized protein n=1 Tax=Melastoma candidum TaxID=119954 RepID=A0ACB9RUT2_9MYRT|nr:hypothetical protein MLD38_008600 [Melastoma candidum]